MVESLYLSDSYLQTCKAKVAAIKDGKFIFLDRTVFYPRGGGQPCDMGKLLCNGKEYSVISVSKMDGNIAHETSGECNLKEGDEVECIIDWPRRYKLMRMHTAGHVLGSLMYKQGMLITGNQIDVDKTRFDFSMENFSKEAFISLVAEANVQIARNLPVEISFLPREEALKIDGAVKLANALPPDIKELRMVKIGDVDYQADGGTHVKNTSEIGKIVFLGADNKGKNNRRIYYGLE